MTETCNLEDVSPQSALKNLELMHKYLQKRLKSVHDASDLVPYINVLMPLNSLKIQLSSLLHQQFETQKNQSKNIDTDSYESADKIRSLYINLCSLNGIPSDVLHAKIISFLPSTEYKKLPMLSTHFRDIMRNFPFIYNHKKYTVQLLIKNRSFSVTPNTSICVMHNNKNIMIKPSSTEINDRESDNIWFPFYDINIWKIYCESVADWLWVGSEYRNQSEDEVDEQSDKGLNGNITENITYLDNQCIDKELNELNETNDSYNYSSIQLLSKSNGSIKKLEIENLKLTIQSKIFTERNKFNQCLILNIRQSPTYDSILNNNNNDSFCKLQYLEIFYPKQDKLLQNKLCEAELLKTDPANLSLILDDRQLDQFYAHIARKKVLCDAINNILSSCNHTLISFVYHDDNESEILSWGWCSLMLQHLENCRKYKGILSIPRNIEFLSLRNSSFITDLTKCNKLIGIEILGDTHYTEIKWPQNYIIPYSYLSPPKMKHLSSNHWKNILIAIDRNNRNDLLIDNDEINKYFDHIPMTKFICLGKRISRATPSLKFSWDPELDDLNEIVDDDNIDQLQRFKINDVIIKEINSKKYQRNLHKNNNNKGIDCDDYKEINDHHHHIDNLCLPNKCLLLNKVEMNKDLFNKLMIYKFNIEQVRLSKIEIYNKWWDLGAGLWIKNIGIIEKWNGRSKKKSSYWSVTE